MGIEIISFDVDGTLVDPDYNELIWQRAIPKLVANKDNIDFKTALEKVQHEYDNIGENNIKWYDISYWIDFFQLDIDYKDLLHKYENKIKIFPETKIVLEKLSAKYKLICISSMPREFLIIKIKKLRNYFLFTFSALSDYQQLKNKKVYKRICQKINVSPDKLLHVGDSEKSDYIAAKEAGLKVLLIDRYKSGYEEKHYKDVIYSLTDVLERVVL